MKQLKLYRQKIKLNRNEASGGYLSGAFTYKLNTKLERILMSTELIKNTAFPHSVESLAADLKKVGLATDSVVLIHTSLSKVGWVNGGAMAFVEALMTVVDETKGTIVMPAQTGDWSEPSRWQYPPVPESWWQTIRDTMPAFDPVKTPCPHMGVVANLFRTYPNVYRSAHPAVSFSAWGKEAKEITADHSLNFGLGEYSPLKKLYEREAQVLTIGTDYETSTAMHLGEYRAPHAPLTEEGAAVLANGKRVWRTYEDIELDEDQFGAIGEQMEKDGLVSAGTLGNAQTRLYGLRDAVDYAANHFTEYRQKMNKK